MRIFVGNLSWETRDGDLEAAFAAYGAVESASVLMDRETGRSKGFAFVEMADKAQAESAISSLNGSSLGGRPLTVNEAKPREERPRNDFQRNNRRW